MCVARLSSIRRLCLSRRSPRVLFFSLSFSLRSPSVSSSRRRSRRTKSRERRKPTVNVLERRWRPLVSRESLFCLPSVCSVVGYVQLSVPRNGRRELHARGRGRKRKGKDEGAWERAGRRYKPRFRSSAVGGTDATAFTSMAHGSC